MGDYDTPQNALDSLDELTHLTARRLLDQSAGGETKCWGEHDNWPIVRAILYATSAVCLTMVDCTKSIVEALRISQVDSKK
jgi:hypothetical protein